MNRQPAPIQSSIIFLYYQDLEPVAQFYGDILGLEMVEDQGWAKIFQTSPTSFVGIVDGEHGFHRPSANNAVTITLAVADVDAWYDYLRSKNVKIVAEKGTSQAIQVASFFFEDPGGYTFEVQRFLNPDLAHIFHQGP
jgi:catechol 2,3-dioxygenase-like lactoylglutathione lyase family enzyme